MEEQKEKLIKKHLTKYYYHKDREIRKDDILPMSRILPMMDEYAEMKTKPLLAEIEKLKESVAAWTARCEKAENGD